MRFTLFLLIICAALSAKTIHKDYAYLSIGATPAHNDNNLASQLGAGYRINLKKSYFPDSIDINISYIHKNDPDTGFEQLVFPRLLFLQNIWKSIYVGAGASYMESEMYKSINYYFGGYPLKTKRKLNYKGAGANLALGYKVWETAASINFCQYELQLPATFLFKNGKDADFITMTFSLGVGF